MIGFDRGHWVPLIIGELLDMLKVSICGIEHEYNSSLASWIKEQFHNRKTAGAAIWFIVSIQTEIIKLKFLSAGAPQRSRGKLYSHFNRKEQQIIDLWNKMDLNQDNNVSNLLRFLNQIERAVA